MHETEVDAWSEFARDLRKRVRWDIEKIERSLISALSTLPALEYQERTELLKMGRVVAERSGKLALIFLRIAPLALSLIHPSARIPFLRWASIFACQSRETLIDFLEKSRDILGALPEGERANFLDLGLRLASQDCSVSFKYFLSLPQIRKEIPQERLSSWFEEGLPLIRKCLPAALAYYGFESQRSWEVGQENSSAVSLRDVARPLKFFAQALTGRSLRVRPLEEPPGGFQHPLGHLPCTDGETIFLPEVFKDFSSPALNLSAFKLATAHQAGYVEFGTFAFQLSLVHDLFPLDLWRSCLKSISEKGNAFSPLEVFFQLFPKRHLARDLFHLLEGARVDHCLRKEYRGLRKEMDLFVKIALEGRPPVDSLPLVEALLEAILRITVFEDTNHSFPWAILLHREDLIGRAGGRAGGQRA